MPFLKTRQSRRVQGSRGQRADRLSSRTGPRRAFFYPGDGKFIGEWRDNLRHGKGAMHSGSRLYEGDWSRGLKHGYGVLSHKICEGTYVIDYAGDWVHGNKQGKGVYHYPDGGFYEGGWKANRRSGYGCMWFADNTFYSGDWLDDRFHGLGLFVQADGDRYDGHWECGVRSGFGRFYHLRTGQLQEGWWRDGVAVRGTVVDLHYRQSALHPTPYPIPKVEVKEPDKIFDDLDEAGKSLNSEQEIALA